MGHPKPQLMDVWQLPWREYIAQILFHSYFLCEGQLAI